MDRSGQRQDHYSRRSRPLKNAAHFLQGGPGVVEIVQYQEAQASHGALRGEGSGDVCLFLGQGVHLLLKPGSPGLD